mmetsp:Transcript_48314/g.127143  ORF Transcript_48314/g.127143 Transcript_48314/m.127143 type:complete len:205 (-) Transcript_48314:6-620(-)
MQGASGLVGRRASTSKVELVRAERLLLAARLVAADKLALAVKHLALGAPAQPDATLAVAAHVGDRILLVERIVVPLREPLLPRPPLVRLHLAAPTLKVLQARVRPGARRRIIVPEEAMRLANGVHVAAHRMARRDARRRCRVAAAVDVQQVLVHLPRVHTPEFGHRPGGERVAKGLATQLLRHRRACGRPRLVELHAARVPHAP